MYLLGSVPIFKGVFTDFDFTLGGFWACAFIPRFPSVDCGGGLLAALWGPSIICVVVFAHKFVRSKMRRFDSRQPNFHKEKRRYGLLPVCGRFVAGLPFCRLSQSNTSNF